MLRVKIAIMRKARLTKNWGRVRGVIQNMLQRTRTVREASRWPKRRRAVMQDVVECMKRERGKQPAYGVTTEEGPEGRDGRWLTFCTRRW